MEIKLIIAGFGGQGIIMAGQLLACAGMLEKNKVVLVPSYGPEMRGGTANCTVILKDGEIYSPVVAHPDILLALNQPSLERFEDQMASVEELLKELALGHIPLLRVFNKEDKVESAFAEKVRQRYDGVSICALDRGTFFPLLRKIEKILWGTQEGEKGAFNGGQDERDHRELAAPLLSHR